MTETLPVHVNRDDVGSIAVDPSFEATGTFAVVLHNHGSPTHVHLRLDDDLVDATSLAATNHYVEPGSATRVVVTVETDRRPIEGDLEVLTGFGSRSATVAVDLVEPEADEEAVHVDESLGDPGAGAPTRPDPEPLLPDWATENAPVLGLAGLALFVAAVAVAVSDAASVLVGLLAVLVGLVAAGVFLRKPG